MKRIRIYIGRHLCTAPRALKEADALAEAGFAVSVHGVWFDPRLVERDQRLLKGRNWNFAPYADGRPGDLRSSLRWFRLRLARKWALAAWKRRHRLSPDLFGYGTRLLLRHALVDPADLSIFHSEAGLYAARQLRLRGLATGVDFEDWFSRDLPETERANRPVEALAEFEGESVRTDKYVTAASLAMATGLACAFSGPAPTVTYNSFPALGISGPASRERGDGVIRLFWFSQHLGPDRGLELLFDALPRLDFSWQLNLVADDPGCFFTTLCSRVPAHLHPRIQRQDTVPNDELAACIAQNDVGLALDLPHCPSRDLTVTNKVFQYLQAGLAVVATRTAGHQEVFTQAPDAGVQLRENEASALAEGLNTLCAPSGFLARAQKAASHVYTSRFAHELQKPRYAALARQALKLS